MNNMNKTQEKEQELKKLYAIVSRQFATNGNDNNCQCFCPHLFCFCVRVENKKVVVKFFFEKNDNYFVDDFEVKSLCLPIDEMAAFIEVYSKIVDAVNLLYTEYMYMGEDGIALEYSQEEVLRIQWTVE